MALAACRCFIMTSIRSSLQIAHPAQLRGERAFGIRIRYNLFVPWDWAPPTIYSIALYMPHTHTPFSFIDTSGIRKCSKINITSSESKICFWIHNFDEGIPLLLPSLFLLLLINHLLPFGLGESSYESFLFTLWRMNWMEYQSRSDSLYASKISICLAFCTLSPNKTRFKTKTSTRKMINNVRPAASSN